MRTLTTVGSHATTALPRPREQPTRTHTPIDGIAHRGQILTTRLGLVLPDDLTYEEWKQAGPKLFRIADASAWCLGDWLAHGKQKYGNRYRRATEEAGLDYQTLRNYAWIARKFDLSRRRETLSFQHHAEVAALPVDEQDQWLDLANAEGWSRNRLRGSVRGRSKDDRSPTASMFIPRVPVAQEQLDWWREAAEDSHSTFEEWIVTALNSAATETPERSGVAS